MAHSIIQSLGLEDVQQGAGTGTMLNCRGTLLKSISPIDGECIGTIRCATQDTYDRTVAAAAEAFKTWRMVPAPKRGDIVRQIGIAVREKKSELGALASLEVGKIRAEGEGEVQEMIDIADFAVGQSRMLYGLTMHSERPSHRMYEQWHPLGPVGVITAFNFPVAVWSWNAMIGLICGDTIIWKPSFKAPLTALAIMKIAWRVLKENSMPDGVLNIVIGSRNRVGSRLVADRRVPLISATGSVAMGRAVAQKVGARLGKTILELGGNNAVIVAPSADLKTAVQAIVFGAVGTAGQRCTTTRRVIAHQSIYASLKKALVKAYKQVSIGDPLAEGILMGPLIDRKAVDNMQAALKEAVRQGGKILHGGKILSGGLYDTGTYVTPCICEIAPDRPIVRQETFAPILYLSKYRKIEEAVFYQNDVPQGLSSSLFTTDMKESELFLSHQGSDCGLANVNMGTSGAEIGGAFGGEKDTGGGRESGSDVWKAYMRRQTNTINWSDELPLAQGIRFDIE